MSRAGGMALAAVIVRAKRSGGGSHGWIVVDVHGPPESVSKILGDLRMLLILAESGHDMSSAGIVEPCFPRFGYSRNTCSRIPAGEAST